MARWATGTAGSEFFIVIGDAPELDHGGAFDEGYAVFGRVVLGMEIVRMINGLETVACASLPYLDGQRLRNPVPLEIARERNEGA